MTEPERNKRFKFLPDPKIPEIETTKNRSQIALTGLTESVMKAEKGKKKKKEKKKKRKHDDSVYSEPPVKMERS